MDLGVVRTFVSVADLGQFQEAAADLAITQQAVSKRIAALERELGVRLFVRAAARGVRLTLDGKAFLPHARDLLAVEDRAIASVRPGYRALRIDTISRRIAPGLLVRDFHHDHPEIELDIVTLMDAKAAIEAVQDGTLDATFRALKGELPNDLSSVRTLDDALQLLVGPKHVFTSAHRLSPEQLAGHRIWMPGNTPGTEWAAYYDEFADTFGLTIDAIGPNFGTEALLDALAESSDLATIVSDAPRLVWPASYDLRLIPLHDPTPVYPHSIIWRRDNPHPSLTVFLDYLASARDSRTNRDAWTPTWAQDVEG
ncbi:LysR family transcriptional regulator [Nocardioides hungaricus]